MVFFAFANSENTMCSKGIAFNIITSLSNDLCSVLYQNNNGEIFHIIKTAEKGCQAIRTIYLHIHN